MQIQLKSIFILLSVFISTTVFGQNPWSVSIEREIQLPDNCTRYTIPTKGATFSLNLRQMTNLLIDAPLDNSRSNGKVITLPLPNGKFESFTIYESPVFEDDLSKKYPSIKTYQGKSLTTNATVRLDLTPQGFHASIRDQNRHIYIDPYAFNQKKYYIIYHLKDLLDNQKEPFICGTESIYTDELLEENILEQTDIIQERTRAGLPVTLRTYPTAIATTGEFTAFHGGKEGAIAAVATIINRLNQIFNAELAINLVLITENDRLIFTDAQNDGFTNGNTQKMIEETQRIIDGIIGFGYKWGHSFGTNGSFSGLAQVGAICGSSRARGVSTMRNPIGDGFVVSIIAHEMGHQMGASHSMSSCHNVFSGGAYEPGSGSTIMSYAGICTPENNIVSNSDPYYFTNSLQQIKQVMFDGNGNDCATKTTTSNTAPSVEIPLEKGFFIPIKTPFELTAIGTDTENDSIAYCWEQYDLGPMSPPGSPKGNGPLFRSFPPNENPTRIFPRLENIIKNVNNKSEFLPTYSRNLTFRCTVRDNVPNYGGTSWEKIAFKATDKAGPFKVEFPNSKKDTLIVGDFIAVKWDVSNTDLAPVNCKNVNIYLSTDGGYTYPTILAENVPNDGSEFVEIPDMVSDKVRIKIHAANNIFFDISNFNTRITKATKPGFAMGIESDSYHVCLPDEIEIGIVTSNFLGFSDDIEFTVSNLPENVVATFEKTSLQPGNPNTLYMDFSNYLEEGNYAIEIQGKANDSNIITRVINVKTTSNIFSSIKQISPTNGADISQLPTYEWSTAVDADRYLLEVATSPSFDEASIVASTDTLTGSSLVSTVLLDANNIYFWRITPINECGLGEPIGTFSCHTVSVNCQVFEQEDANIVLTQTGKPSKETTIVVNESGIIADVNIPTFHGNHAWFSDLDVSLTSPAGTKVFIFHDKCLNYNGLFSFKLDDQSPYEFSCPPKGKHFRPINPLAAFNGENIQGNWVLGISDDHSGNGGALDGWSLELCGSLSQSPLSITNLVLPVQKAESRIISSEFLSTEDPSLLSKDLEYVIINSPKHGNIYRYGKILGPGKIFTEWEIAHNVIIYKHNGGDIESDEFPFLVKNSNNNWTGQQIFQITIDENAVISDAEITFNDRNVRLFPNPASEEFSIELINQSIQSITIDIYNVQGQKIVRLDEVKQNMITINTSNYSKGIYFVKITSGNDTITKKMMIE